MTDYLRLVFGIACVLLPGALVARAFGQRSYSAVFGDLHLRTVDEFKDGGLHPGYAFPLWHGLLALVSWFSGLDPQTVIERGPAVLAPLACVVAWESGLAVLRSRAAGAGLLVVTL